MLGLLREKEGVAANVLESLGVTLEGVRGEVSRIIGEGDEIAQGQIPFTPRAKKVLELSLLSAKSLGHDYIGTEHILLGLAREGEGVAARILTDEGASPSDIAAATIEVLGATGHEDFAETFSTHFALAQRMPRRIADYAGRSDRVDIRVLAAVLVGWLLFAASAALGVLVGWLIWG